MSLRFGYGLNGFTDHRLEDALALLAAYLYVQCAPDAPALESVRPSANQALTVAPPRSLEELKDSASDSRPRAPRGRKK